MLSLETVSLKKYQAVVLFFGKGWIFMLKDHFLLDKQCLSLNKAIIMKHDIDAKPVFAGVT